MVDNNMIFFAKKGNDEALTDPIVMRPDMANKHGFICGATGTGKSVTLKVLAESFSQLGVPVFMSDVKGDMAGVAAAGEDSESMQKRLDRFGIRDMFKYEGYPVSIFDIYGRSGIPLRTTVSEMGPQLLAQVLGLNDTQTELMQVIFKIADDQGLVLTDTKDMKAMLQYAADHSDDFKADYGNIAQQSVATIIRSIVALESEGADMFFGEPAIDIRDFFMKAGDGRGNINILAAETLISQPRLYSAFMLYLLSELFELLPEVGDPEKPKMVFFFDEAHLLFKNASKSLLDKIEQVVKLIRSKGVSIFFVTQSPGDIPGAVMSQLGNKIEHALHAYTPAEQKVLKAAADAFRENPEFKTEELMQNLGTGEAVVSVLDEKGAPTVAEHAYILPPESRMGALTADERKQINDASPFMAKYGTMVDNISAYERITGKVAQTAAPADDMGGLTPTIEIETTVEKAPNTAQEALGGDIAADPLTGTVIGTVRDVTSAVGEKAEAVLGTTEARRVARTTGGTIGREVGKAIGEAVLGKKGRTIGGNIGAQLGRSIMGTLTTKK
ncbi:MAG: DUF853 family protein [Clostridiales bacterium]|nr:DUF853 family protein [Candidatus Crickella caballi]